MIWETYTSTRWRMRTAYFSVRRPMSPISHPKLNRCWIGPVWYRKPTAVCFVTRLEQPSWRFAEPERSMPSIRLNHFFPISEMIVPGSSYWNIGMGLEKGDVEKDLEAIQTMKVLGHGCSKESASQLPSQ